MIAACRKHNCVFPELHWNDKEKDFFKAWKLTDPKNKEQHTNMKKLEIGETIESKNI